jgi:hypothetical protein
MSWKRRKTEYLSTKEWLAKEKNFTNTFKSKCWCCNITDKSCSTKHKHYESQGKETIKDVVCLCSDCYKSINKMMFNETDFVMRMHDLKRMMNKNGYHRLLTYEAVKDFKDNYLTEQIELFKKTKDADLQHELIKKVLSLPIN